ncbi:MAG TPA: acyltransferase family protein [Solirubrobacterales bacterium]|nr:acyltransferase family protein [Solirubrobacterales bacterium]
MNPGTSRLHHLDALRALTMFLILPAHALTLISLQRGGWNDLEESVFWAIHVFRLPLFFFIAGFFAALVLDSQGFPKLLRNRAIRIGIPLVLGVLTVAPLLSLCFHAASGGTFRPEATALATFATPRPSYLWFLWHLMLLYAGVLAIRSTLGGQGRAMATLRGAGAWLLSHRLGPILLAVPTAVLLYRQPTWMASTPPDSFVPDPDLLAYYAIFFTAGWTIFATPGLRDSIELRPWPYVALAALALPAALALYLAQSEPSIGEGRWFHILALLLLSLATWSIVLGLLGISRHFLKTRSPRLRYLADASYWIYLSHLLPMTALAALILDLRIPDGLRFALLIAATLSLIYPAYGAFVRHSAIGRVLHGPRSRSEQRPRRRLTQPARAAARRA